MIEYQSFSNELLVETAEITQNCGNIKEKISIDNYNSSCRYFLELKCPKGQKFISEEICFKDNIGEVVLPNIVSANKGRVFVQLVIRDNEGYVVGRSLVSQNPIYHINYSINAEIDLTNERVGDVIECIYKSVNELKAISDVLKHKLDSGELNGKDGLKGDKGDRGIQGVKGEKGDVGPQGPKGNTGAIGPQGPKGNTGAIGPQGPKGDKGDIGPVGPEGPKGNTGKPGMNGRDGTIIKVKNIIQDTIGFSEDPQKQLNGKANINDCNMTSMVPSSNYEQFLTMNNLAGFNGYNAKANGWIYYRINIDALKSVGNFIQIYIADILSKSVLYEYNTRVCSSYDNTISGVLPIAKGQKVGIWHEKDFTITNIVCRFIYAKEV